MLITTDDTETQGQKGGAIRHYDGDESLDDEAGYAETSPGMCDLRINTKDDGVLNARTPIALKRRYELVKTSDEE